MRCKYGRGLFGLLYTIRLGEGLRFGIEHKSGKRTRRLDRRRTHIGTWGLGRVGTVPILEVTRQEEEEVEEKEEDHLGQVNSREGGQVIKAGKGDFNTL